MYHPALFIHIHRKLYQGVRSKKCNITLNPLGPTGPGRPDIMDPSAEMTNPGSPFSPCVYTQVHLKKKKKKQLPDSFHYSVHTENKSCCMYIPLTLSPGGPCKPGNPMSPFGPFGPCK